MGSQVKHLTLPWGVQFLLPISLPLIACIPGGVLV